MSLKNKIVAILIIIFFFSLIALRMQNLAVARKIYLFQKQFTDFSKAESFTYRASPEKKKCLLIHGVTGSTHELRPLAIYLSKYGISSYCPKLKGHGTNFYDVEKVTMEDLLAQIRAEAAKEKYDYLVGVCAGSNLVVDLAAEKDYEKIVLISPLFRYRDIFLIRQFAPLIPFIKFVYRYYPKKNPDKYKDLIDYKVLPVQNIYDLYQYNKITLAKLDKIDEKTLILYGSKDDLYNPTLPQELDQKIRRSKLITIQNGDHVLTKIKENDKVLKIIKDFLLE